MGGHAYLIHVRNSALIAANCCCRRFFIALFVYYFRINFLFFRFHLKYDKRRRNLFVRDEKKRLEIVLFPHNFNFVGGEKENETLLVTNRHIKRSEEKKCNTIIWWSQRAKWKCVSHVHYNIHLIYIFYERKFRQAITVGIKKYNKLKKTHILHSRLLNVQLFSLFSSPCLSLARCSFVGEKIHTNDNRNDVKWLKPVIVCARLKMKIHGLLPWRNIVCVWSCQQLNRKTMQSVRTRQMKTRQDNVIESIAAHTSWNIAFIVNQLNHIYRI